VLDERNLEIEVDGGWLRIFRSFIYKSQAWTSQQDKLIEGLLAELPINCHILQLATLEDGPTKYTTLLNLSKKKYSEVLKNATAWNAAKICDAIKKIGPVKVLQNIHLMAKTVDLKVSVLSRRLENWQWLYFYTEKNLNSESSCDGNHIFQHQYYRCCEQHLWKEVRNKAPVVLVGQGTFNQQQKKIGRKCNFSVDEFNERFDGVQKRYEDWKDKIGAHLFEVTTRPHKGFDHNLDQSVMSFICVCLDLASIGEKLHCRRIADRIVALARRRNVQDSGLNWMQREKSASCPAQRFLLDTGLDSSKYEPKRVSKRFLEWMEEDYEIEKPAKKNKLDH